MIDRNVIGTSTSFSGPCAAPASKKSASPGDSLYFDARAPHGPETLVERPMTFLSIIIYPRV